jgi:hypothetical protein
LLNAEKVFLVPYHLSNQFSPGPQRDMLDHRGDRRQRYGSA